MPILDQNTPQSYVPYLATGTGVFSATGSPEGVQNGGIGSIYTDLLNGDLYTKTTPYATLIGWVLLGGGGGSGTVTTFSAGNLSPLFNSSVATATTTPALTFAQISQLQNLFFASPNGSSGNPTFRAIATADLAGVALAALPANGVQYNNGTNGFAGSVNFLFDPATATIQAGVAAGITGKLQLRSSVSGSITHTVNNPAGNYSYIWPDALPTTNDLLRVTVSGSNVTISSVAASALGFPSINATDGVIPYRSSSSAFSDSPFFRIASDLVGFGNTTTNPAFFVSSTGFFGSNGIFVRTGSSATGTYLGARNLVVTDTVNPIANNVCRITSSASVALELSSNVDMAWSNTSGLAANTKDIGLSRRQAGVLRVTNGVSGSNAGQILLGNSSATPIGQAHIINSAVGIEPLYLEAIASTSVPTIRGVQSGIQSFALNPSGKIVGGMNIPTTNQQFSAIGNAKSDVSTIGNVDSGTDNLLSFVIQAKVLNNTGDYAEFDAFGEFENNANNKRLAIVFGATTIFNTGSVAFGSTALVNWRTNTKIIRTGSTSQKVITTFWSNDPSTPFLQEIFLSGEDLTINRTVQFQAEATANDDVVQYHLESKLCVAQTS